MQTSCVDKTLLFSESWDYYSKTPLAPSVHFTLAKQILVWSSQPMFELVDWMPVVNLLSVKFIPEVPDATGCWKVSFFTCVQGLEKKSIMATLW